MKPQPGTKVLVNTGSAKLPDWQEGEVVSTRYDDVAHRIAPTYVAVRVSNGQGTWGYPLSKIKVQA